MRTFELIRDGCGGKLKVYRGKKEIAYYYLTSIELESLEQALTHNNTTTMKQEEIIKELKNLKEGHWTEKSADAIAAVLDEYIDNQGS